MNAKMSTSGNLVICNLYISSEIKGLPLSLKAWELTGVVSHFNCTVSMKRRRESFEDLEVLVDKQEAKGLLTTPDDIQLVVCSFLDRASLFSVFHSCTHFHSVLCTSFPITKVSYFITLLISELPTDVFICAARNGHVELMKWLLTIGCPLDNNNSLKTLAAAARRK